MKITKNADSMKQMKKHNAKLRHQLNESWQAIEQTGKYRRASNLVAFKLANNNIEADMMDGIILRLNEKHDGEPMVVKMRLFRRIVEKRQAQVVHKTIGRSRDRRSSSIAITNFRKSMEWFRNMRNAV